MPNALILVEQEIWEEVVEKEFLEIMPTLEMTKIECVNLLDYAEDVAKA